MLHRDLCFYAGGSAGAPVYELGEIIRTATILKLTGHRTSLFLVMVPNVRDCTLASYLNSTKPAPLLSGAGVDGSLRVRAAFWVTPCRKGRLARAPRDDVLPREIYPSH